MNLLCRAFIMLFPVILTGCSRTQVRERAFVQSAGIEYDGEEYRVALVLYEDSEVFKGHGKTFEEAVNSAETGQGRDFYTGHTQIVVTDLKSRTKVLESLVNDDISSGCIVLTEDDPCGYTSENDMKKTMDSLRTASRNGKYKEKNIRDILCGCTE